MLFFGVDSNEFNSSSFIAISSSIPFTSCKNAADIALLLATVGGSYSLPPIRNGPITTSIRLGAALRYFAGGAPYDIMCCFCIAYSEVLVSVWIVVDAINEQYWAVWFDEETNYSAWQGATTKWNQEVANLVKSNHNFASERIQIDFKDNKFTIKKR